MFIISLGDSAAKIADEFFAYPQYEIYKIGNSLEEGPRTYNIKQYETPEEYEEKCPDLSVFFSEIKDEIIFIVIGSGNITGSSLRILEQLKHCKINILYVRPDLSLLSNKKRLQEKITFNVFQQYTRSGLFEKLYLIDNQIMEQIVNNIPLAQFYKTLNSLIVSTLHMVNVCKNDEPILLTDFEETKISKICTLGISDPVSAKDTMFYNLSNITNKFYYYSISKTVLEKDGKLLSKIKNQLKQKLSEEVKGGFGVYSNEWKENYVYVEVSTHFIQEQLVDT